MSFELAVKEVAIRQAARFYAYYQRQSIGLGERFMEALIQSYAHFSKIRSIR